MPEEEKPLEAREAEMLQACEEEMRRFEQNWDTYLNNMALNFSPNQRAGFEEYGMMDEISVDPNRSAKRNLQTPRQFYETLDEVSNDLVAKKDEWNQMLTELDVLSEQLGKLPQSNDQESWAKEAKKAEVDALQTKLNEVLKPIYIRLRVMGYGHKDLTK